MRIYLGPSQTVINPSIGIAGGIISDGISYDLHSEKSTASMNQIPTLTGHTALLHLWQNTSCLAYNYCEPRQRPEI